MDVWDDATRNWERGSLPSGIDSHGFVVDSAAPQCAHTYDKPVVGVVPEPEIYALLLVGLGLIG
ncbi:PEP-CTERM protein-sorting domain-containing protein [Nitrosospira sp. Nsp11]|uniref:PEP-CTERM sorting domain-containing protein n=1 Tax=Nitrosospira sp. Nsp11 TaxID=1855338 RepID=UPI000910E3FA|nr:PEP-CTERM sorting domain-containing protein [Nitrosospira sp. Nsp11]SHL99526.1 PEP-CTERM protein-sorting domain-containing protein [Nitrosospira sp. Nsp11]